MIGDEMLIFEKAWDSVRKIDMARAEQARRAEADPSSYTDTVVDVDLGDPSGVDPCCWAAFNDPRIANWWFNDWSEVEIEAESEGTDPCGWLREFMESMPTIFREMGEDPMERKTPEEGEKQAQTVEAVLADWDACSAKSLSGDFTASEDSFDDAWDSVQKELDILSINPLLQTATGRMKNPGLLEESWGVPEGFRGQDGRFVLQPEKRFDPLTAQRVFGAEPSFGFTEEQKRVLRARGQDPDGLKPTNHNQGINDGNDVHPINFTASNERRQAMGKKPLEWEELTVRPEFGEMKLAPGDAPELYPIPAYEFLDNRTGRSMKRPASVLESIGPYFGERSWPKVKGLQGLGWHPREGSAGHLTWNRGQGDLARSPTGMGSIDAFTRPLVDDLSIDPSMRRQGLGSDLVDLFRYSLPASRLMGQRGKGGDVLMRNPMETVSARPFWDRYFQSRWGPEDTHVPSNVHDADFINPMEMHPVPLRPGQRIPPMFGAIDDSDMFLAGRPGAMNSPDDFRARDLAPLPPENRFNMALTRPKDLLSEIDGRADLDSSDRMNRWLARQLIREQGGSGKGGSSFKSRARKLAKPGKFTRLSEQYPYIVRDL